MYKFSIFKKYSQTIGYEDEEKLSPFLNKILYLGSLCPPNSLCPDPEVGYLPYILCYTGYSSGRLSPILEKDKVVKGMNWQDIVLGVGGFAFSIALLPTVLGKNKPAKTTSAMTSFFLWSFCSVYISYHLWLTLAAGMLSALTWTVIFIQSAKYKPRKMGFVDAVHRR
jgi:hypothetical protein